MSSPAVEISPSTSTHPAYQHSQLNELLHPLGFEAQRSIADTLQGQIWTVKHAQSQQECILKVTSKQLHSEKISMVLNQPVVIQEDIVKEATVMKYLSRFHDEYPSSIIAYKGFFESNKNYYLLMEHGGDPMFDFIVHAHDLLERKRLDIAEWMRVVRVIFKQMVQAIDFLHSHNVVHMDLSLENMTMVNDVKVSVQHAGTPHENVVFSKIDDVKVKIIDFGLAERFKPSHGQDSSKRFQSSKFCGKRIYQSPELVQQKEFNAVCNDIWCAGVCLFMMVSGSAPWAVADESDTAYKLIMSGEIKYLLQHWQKTAYFDENLLDLMMSIFQPESKRISLADIKNHPWLNGQLPPQTKVKRKPEMHTPDPHFTETRYDKPIAVH